ncbi:MAG TPA: hypothetical protein VG147_00950 [Solirubrobacteraceae bacterium]|nr:hypothetical protein [Solirubrobacteraceae bacterium]
MPTMRSTCLLGALAAAVGVSLTVSAPAPAAKYIECQHPVGTGVEISHLRHVSSATACPVALSLYRWENKDDHMPKLYKCAGNPPGTPVLKLHTFDGWGLSIAKSGYFEMSRGQSSFYVTGTDFPLACN